jgi:hypothetical protein
MSPELLYSRIVVITAAQGVRAAVVAVGSKG